MLPAITQITAPNAQHDTVGRMPHSLGQRQDAGLHALDILHNLLHFRWHAAFVQKLLHQIRGHNDINIGAPWEDQSHPGQVVSIYVSYTRSGWAYARAAAEVGSAVSAVLAVSDCTMRTA